MYKESSYQEYLAKLIKRTLLKYPSAVAERLMTCPITGFSGVRKALGEIDLEFFAKAYFPQYFEFETPQFHKDAYKELDVLLNSQPNGVRKVRAWPRGNAKSTIYNFFTPTKAALYGHRKFIVQVSDTESQAHGFLGDIKNSLDNNEHIIEDFGDVRGATWRADMINITATDGSVIWLSAVGAGSGIRGLRKAQFRPDLIIVDDLENDESVLTFERIKKLKMWFNRALMNLGSNTTDVLMVGTVLASDCVLEQIMTSPSWDSKKLSAIINWSNSPLWDAWTKLYTDLALSKDERDTKAQEFYEENKEDLLDGVEVLWEEYWPYVELYKKYIDIGESAFHSEQQNDPVNFDEAIIKEEWIHYYTDEEIRTTRMLAYYGALDPSMGKSRLSDYTAIITLAKGDTGFMYVMDVVLERMNPDKIIQTMIQKGKEHKYTRFGVETNQWQDLLRVMLIERSAKQDLYIPIVELRHAKDKVIRVQSLIPYIKNGYIKFNREHKLLMSQILGFPKLRHDDGPDALEMAVRLVTHGPSSGSMQTGIAVQERRKYDDEDDLDSAAYADTAFFD
jgi:predicted phage terminase large subunit-like protein